MVLSLLLPALTIPLAQAGVPVIYDGVSGGDAASLLASVSEHTGLAAAELDAMPLDELLAAPPQALGDAVMRRCAGGPTELETVRAELVRAEAAGQQGDHLGAQDHLDLAVANLGCLGELVDTRVAARIFMLRGAIEAEQGDTEAARGELRTALAFAPDLAWDLSMPGEGQPLLIEERATPAALQVRVVPAGTSSGPWVDGRTLQGKGDRVAVASGLHLAQHPSPAGIRSAWLVVAGNTTLVLPGAFRRPILPHIEDAAGQPEIAALLAATLPDFHAAYVAVDGGVWLVSREPDGSITTFQSAAPPPPPPVEESTGRKHKKRDR